MGDLPNRLDCKEKWIGGIDDKVSFFLKLFLANHKAKGLVKMRRDIKVIMFMGSNYK